MTCSELLPRRRVVLEQGTEVGIVGAGGDLSYDEVVFLRNGCSCPFSGDLGVIAPVFERGCCDKRTDSLHLFFGDPWVRKPLKDDSCGDIETLCSFNTGDQIDAEPLRVELVFGEKVEWGFAGELLASIPPDCRVPHGGVRSDDPLKELVELIGLGKIRWTGDEEFGN